MKTEATLIFPHQLFQQHPALDKSRQVFLIEDPLFFGDVRYPLNFHKKKLIFHRASMKAYEDYLTDQGYDVIYLQYSSFREDRRSNYLFVFFNKMRITTFHYADVTDFLLEKRIQNMAKDLSKRLVKYPTPMFLTEEEFLNNYFSKKKSYLMAAFYIEQRKQLNILVEDGKPIGGKWSFDDENRKKIPKGFKSPLLNFPDDTEYEVEAIDYVEKYFPDNPGDGFDFIYPVTFEQAEDWLIDFLENRFKYFGDFEDAIDSQETYLFHSVLTPILNSGLLTPNQIIEKALNFAKENKVPLNSLEGFIRQIVGWREYMRSVYLHAGVKQRTTNFFKFNKKMPKSFYDGSTGIEPVDVVIKRVLEKAYSHHIERLMVLGNFMLLCEIDPDEVYKWFMEMYIDAYDWVMVPNVYGMSQYADGGLICTKPYISSSNYILKMSNFEKGNWSEIWDALYWRFIFKHKKVLAKNPRMSMMIVQLNKMNDKKLKQHINIAERFLEQLR
ncbi:MAG: cryptochrome/photolyase family protein [Ignavibacterium sp.]|jgi:deoxyribodipyrimidine photolyase-related protein|nr:cryptochrome/photolyase family protein [Ignavibacterium sp.]